MCTLTFAWQVFDDYLAVAANRDEALDRPASPPAVRGEAPRVVAPRDEKAGGTWIGYNDHGTFAALTNRWTGTPDAGDRSRGLLVRDTLDRRSAVDAADYLREEVRERRYEPFHALVADESDAILVEYDVDLSVTSLAPGVYVVGNTGWCGVRSGPVDADERQRTETFFVPGRRPDAGRRQADNDRAVLDVLVDAASDVSTADEWLDRGGAVLSDHSFGVCIHGAVPDSPDERRSAGSGFGTRSSSLVRLGETRAWRYADGPPCETPYDPVDSP